MIEFNFKEKCCGCGACKSVCPVKAITWKNTDEGFWIPNVNLEICIKCGKCEKKCPVLNYEKSNKKDIEVCMASLYDTVQLKKSASGGVFIGLANYVLDNGGAIGGVIWDNEMNAVYCVSSEESDVEKMRGSKYVQAHPSDCIEKTKQLLKQGKMVLFSGTPCQIAGLVKCTGHPNNLITCGLICEGVASPAVWSVYKKYLEKKYGASLTSAEMRSKKDGWIGGSSVYTFANGKKYIQRRCYSLDAYIAGFIEGLFNRPSCRECNFKGSNQDCDFLIGDFWGATKEQIKINKNEGLSTVIICSEYGKEIWEAVQKNFYNEKIQYDIVKQSNNIEHSGNWAIKRDEFLENILDEKGVNHFQTIVWKSSNKLMKKRIMLFLDKIRLLNLIKK